MKNALSLLAEITEAMPPKQDHRHNLTTDGEKLVLQLMLDTGFEIFVFEEADLSRRPGDLVSEIITARRML